MIEHFSTRDAEPGCQLDYWNNLLGATYDGLVVDPLQPRFHARMARWQLGDIMMIWPDSASAVVARRREGCAAATDQRVVVHIQHSGASMLEERGRTMQVETGDMVLCAGEDYYRFDVGGNHQMLVVELDRAWLADRVPMLDDRIAQVIPGTSAPVRLLHNFLLSLWREGTANLGGESGDAYAPVLADMLAVPLQHVCEPAPQQLRTLPFGRVQGYVEARLDDPALSASMLAQELGVSLRSLQSMMAQAGTTPVNYITDRRLRRAADLLLTDKQSSITDIAYACGFSDSAYFARRFRQHFGMTPRDYRGRH